MDRIDLDAKTDRELLIMTVLQQNSVCEAVKKQDATLYGDGRWPGLVTRVTLLFAVVVLLALDNPMVEKLLISIIK